jgi:hypothetical protein
MVRRSWLFALLVCTLDFSSLILLFIMPPPCSI